MNALGKLVPRRYLEEVPYDGNTRYLLCHGRFIGYIAEKWIRNRFRRPGLIVDNHCVPDIDE